MTLKGFDPKWKDFPDYIMGVTKEIWEDRGIATLNQYYAHDIVVRSPSSVVIGNKGVIAATQATLAEFPDRQLLGEDVICQAARRMATFFHPTAFFPQPHMHALASMVRPQASNCTTASSRTVPPKTM